MPDPLPKIHVLLKREEVDSARLTNEVVIVLDVLFATTTIVHAFSQGVASIYPVSNQDEAVRVANDIGECVLAGESMARPIPGFAQATPLAISELHLRGATLVYCTTNGTPALASVAHAPHVYVGALLNGKALASHVRKEHPDLPVLVVCSGSVDRFNLEDFHGAGHIIDRLTELGDYSLTDSAHAALHAYRGCDSRTALFASRVGQMMDVHSLGSEVEFACRHDTVSAVPKLVGGRLSAVAA